MRISVLIVPAMAYNYDYKPFRYACPPPAECPPCDYPSAVNALTQKKSIPQCAPGTGIMWDHCRCCRRCAAQNGDICDAFNPCDDTKGYTCQDMDNNGTGVCKPAKNSRKCFVQGREFASGEEFNPTGSCETTCICVNGDIGCFPTCAKVPTSAIANQCKKPKMVKPKQTTNKQCCPDFVCPDDYRYHNPSYNVKPKPILGAAGHVAKPISFEMRTLPDGTTCPTQTTEWSPCSRECGWGIRERVTNNNDKCDMRKETVLCQLRPCHYEPTIMKMLNSDRYKDRMCLKTTRPKDKVKYSFSGCKSTQEYKPRYCGQCKSKSKCCTPTKTEIISVEFRCPNDEIVVKQIDQIKACSCSDECSYDSMDIFSSTHLLSHDVQPNDAAFKRH